MQKSNTFLNQFAFTDKLKLSFNNSIAFTGTFLDNPVGVVIGKQLFIPLSEKHQAFTFKITSVPFSKSKPDTLIVSFDSLEEQEFVASFDFSDEVFFIEK